YHTALAALRAGEGTERGVCVLLQMVILTGFIGDLRSDPINLPLLQQMDADLVAAFDRGRKTGAWFFDESVADLCAALLTHHDQQLKTAPLVLLQEAINQLERFKRGEYDGHA
ncbi:Fis family transcriptional regulator, partial [Burkholderia cepacia]|uniref:Fis family transcriptional regulator n=1 Tax=Burkholderia cepacia TaxID=292 RepID=UPI002ABD4EBD